MHLSSFRRRNRNKKNKSKRKAPKEWQVDLGIVSKDEFLEQKKLKEEDNTTDELAEVGSMKGKTQFSTTAPSSKKMTWSKIKKQVKMAQKLEAEQEKIEERKKYYLQRSLGRDEEGNPTVKGSLHYVDVEVWDNIPKSGLRIKRANGRFIFELFDDVVPNVTKLFVEVIEMVSSGKMKYKCVSNELGYRCIWAQHSERLDETAMAVRLSVLLVLAFVVVVFTCVLLCSILLVTPTWCPTFAIAVSSRL